MLLIFKRFFTIIELFKKQEQMNGLNSDTTQGLQIA